jgi:hypothetical protein
MAKGRARECDREIRVIPGASFFGLLCELEDGRYLIRAIVLTLGAKMDSTIETAGKP